MTRLTIVVVPLLLSLGTARAACTDAAAVAATRAAAEAQCPCAAAAATKPTFNASPRSPRRRRRAAASRRQCRASVVGCARKSTCGKAGFVTCFRTTAKGSQTCSVKPSAAKCTAPKGGSAFVGTMPSCCDSCAAGSCAEATTTTTPPPHVWRHDDHDAGAPPDPYRHGRRGRHAGVHARQRSPSTSGTRCAGSGEAPVTVSSAAPTGTRTTGSARRQTPGVTIHPCRTWARRMSTPSPMPGRSRTTARCTSSFGMTGTITVQ